jgi:hypothetical protein
MYIHLDAAGTSKSNKHLNSDRGHCHSPFHRGNNQIAQSLFSAEHAGPGSHSDGLGGSRI